MKTERCSSNRREEAKDLSSGQLNRGVMAFADLRSITLSRREGVAVVLPDAHTTSLDALIVMD